MAENAIPLKESSSNTWTTTDIVLVAVIGVVFGVIEAGLSVPYQLGIAALGPIWTAIFIPFQIGKILAVFIVRKPGVALAAGLIGGLTQFLSGNPAGMLTFAWGLAQGLAVELPFFVTRYRNYHWTTFLVAAGLASVFAKAVSIVAYGWGSLPIQFLIFLWILGFFVSAIENGVVGLAIGRLLQRSGMIRSFRGGTA
jgi:energy-coupling factor transport system substrate-specific component